MVDDLIYAGRIIERYEDPRLHPLSEENYRKYLAAMQTVRDYRSGRR